MKKLLSAFIALALIICSCACASSLLEKSKDFYYNDAADVLEYEAKAEIYFNNKNLEKATGSQIVIATVRSTGSLTTDVYTDRLFNSWGVGDKKKDNGFLLLMVIADDPDYGDYWFSQGSGTGDMIDPGELGDYLEKYLEPDFAKGRYSDGARKIFRVMFEHVRDYYGVNLAYQDYEAIERSGALGSKNSGFTARKESDYISDFEYRLLENGDAEITKYSGRAIKLDIPSELDGHTVTGIGSYAFNSCKSLTSVTIPDSVTSIGDAAFIYCSGLASLAIPDSVKSIGDWAFQNCDCLTTVTIPDSVTSMGANPFCGCRKLTTLKASPESEYLAVIDGVLFSKPDRRLVCYPCAFIQAEYSIPKGIRIIGDSAFAYCRSLTSVTIPESITNIDRSAFAKCDRLTSVTIPGSVTSIGGYAFVYCSGLTSVTIPASVTGIGSYAFSRCGEQLVITVEKGSCAAEYCKENGLAYQYTDALDWLKD